MDRPPKDFVSALQAENLLLHPYLGRCPRLWCVSLSGWVNL